MAMLAEPRRKSKYSINPRGTNWSKDDSKFGQKLMEKMGWSKGKGLGANEDGRVEHVGIKMKSDNKGVGCTNKFVDKWIEHQDDFNDLLRSLNQEQNNSSDDDKERVVSLEKKSKSSKSRVHYMKFTKGKDLSSRSKEDMNCIFGNRRNKQKSEEEEEEVIEAEIIEEKEDKVNVTKDDEHGVKTFTNNFSIQEYFAFKMKQRQQSVLEASDSSNQSIPSIENPNQSETALNKTENLSSKKRKRVSFNLEYHCYESEEEINDSILENDLEEVNKLKRKKSKKRKMSASDSEVTEETEEESIIDEDYVQIKKKQKKKKRTEVEETSEETEIIPRKKKKSEKRQQYEGDEEISQNKGKEKSSQEKMDVQECEKETQSEKKSKKKRKKKNKEENIADGHFESVTDLEDTKPKKKKSKKKLNQDLETDHIHSSPEINSSKKKKKSKNVEMEQVADSTYQPLNKKTKKKKKTKEFTQIYSVKQNLIVADGKLKKKKKEKTTPDNSDSEENSETSGENLKHPKKSKNKVKNLDTKVMQSDDQGPKIVESVEFHPIIVLKGKTHIESLTKEQVGTVCQSFKGSNIHEIGGYLNSGTVATIHYACS